ncbi:hypothetical protein BDF21DRAFT_111596 [Thamnidium elegans]|uniref:NADH:flavin oxidoreductase/NADH oxidase N-terminal domain-containing protein n=1 Tax=Thamnidium elegans TaxID=101142 RepID=A0A8H7ST48_9FUNG|nr:hypothetical protein INT48_003967 [Thamnidium elegans]KAI8067228.1 hypothetical protein BDF21DRAFT_111596 [Thamnidium elegans]
MTAQTNKAILSPIKVGNILLDHRVVLAPLTRLRATVDGVPTDMMLEYYTQRASKGGFLLVESVAISPTAIAYPQAPGIFSKDQISGWKKITDAIHQKGGYTFVQLWHSGRTGNRSLHPNNEQVVSASAITAAGNGILGEPFEDPRALEVSEIKSIVNDFAQAALNAIEAGFDGIEIHSAFGYLLDQFICTSSNQRTDEYGSSIENRLRFTLEVVEAITNAIGPERTAIRVSPGGGEIHSATEEHPIETCSYLMTQLQKYYSKLAYVHFMDTRSEKNIGTDLAKPYRSIWKGPIISSGFSSCNVEHAIEYAEKTGDLIAFGRLFIANPDLPERIRQGYSVVRSNYSTFYTHEAEGYTDYPSYVAK